MTPENFCYWLQGWFELNRTIDHREGISKEGLKVIEEHLQLVFMKVTSEPEIKPINVEEWKKLFEEYKKNSTYPNWTPLYPITCGTSGDLMS